MVSDICKNVTKHSAYTSTSVSLVRKGAGILSYQSCPHEKLGDLMHNNFPLFQANEEFCTTVTSTCIQVFLNQMNMQRCFPMAIAHDNYSPVFAINPENMSELNDRDHNWLHGDSTEYLFDMISIRLASTINTVDFTTLPSLQR